MNGLRKTLLTSPFAALASGDVATYKLVKAPLVESYDKSP